MKKIISYFVIIMFLVSMFPTNAVADGSHSNCEKDEDGLHRHTFSETHSCNDPFYDFKKIFEIFLTIAATGLVVSIIGGIAFAVFETVSENEGNNFQFSENFNDWDSENLNKKLENEKNESSILQNSKEFNFWYSEEIKKELENQIKGNFDPPKFEKNNLDWNLSYDYGKDIYDFKIAFNF